MGWNDPNTGERKQLRAISRRAENPAKDLSKNLIEVNSSIRYMSSMMTVMQNGIDDANRDILQQFQDAITDLAIIFGLSDAGDTLNFDWGDLEIVLKNIGNIFHFDLLNGVPDLLEWAEMIWNNLFARFFDLDNIDLLGLLGKIPISLLGGPEASIISDGNFTTPPEGTTSESGWGHDPAKGKENPGSLFVSGPNSTNDFIRAPITVAPGDELSMGAYLSWSAPAAASSFKILAYNFLGENLVSVQEIATYSPTGTNNTFDTKITGTYVAPAGVDGVGMAYRVVGLTSGTIWVDDAEIVKSGEIEQSWVKDLVGDLGSLFNWIETLVESLLGVFGISPSGGLLDKIFDLSDAFDDLNGSIVIKPLSNLLAWLTSTSPEDWDTVEEIRDNLLPALMRLPINTLIQILSDIFGDIPLIGDQIENGFANWLRTSNANASAANVTANAALALAQSNNSSGVYYSETFSGDGTLDSGKWNISNARLRRRDSELGMSTQTGDGVYSDWLTYNSEFETDGQSIAVVLGKHGMTDKQTSLFLHCDTNCTRFVYLNIYSNKWYLGQGSRSGGSWSYNDWVEGNYEFDPGHSVALQVKGNLYTITVNGTNLMQYPDTGLTAPKGATYRRAGMRLEQGRLFFVNSYSYFVRAFAIADV